MDRRPESELAEAEPPALARRMVALTARRDDRAVVIGDLHEEFLERAKLSLKGCARVVLASGCSFRAAFFPPAYSVRTSEIALFSSSGRCRCVLCHRVLGSVGCAEGGAPASLP